MVAEKKTFHHDFSIVPSNKEERTTPVCLPSVPGAGHLGQPVVVAALAPVLGLVAPRHAEHADLVTLPAQILEERKKRFYNE